MDREIKFRAFDSKEKRFIDLFDYDFWIRDDGIVSKISYDYDGDGRYDSSESPQLHIILTQYTGLKDKNGKEIYEGDICQMEYFEDNGLGQLNRSTSIGMCVFEKGCYRVDEVPLYLENNVLVIGNIYENPELIGV